MAHTVNEYMKMTIWLRQTHHSFFCACSMSLNGEGASALWCTCVCCSACSFGMAAQFLFPLAVVLTLPCASVAPVLTCCLLVRLPQRHQWCIITFIFVCHQLINMVSLNNWTWVSSCQWSSDFTVMAWVQDRQCHSFSLWCCRPQLHSSSTIYKLDF